MAIIDLKDCLMHVKDATSNVLTIQIGEGNIDYTTKTNVEYVKRRGLLSTTREGDEEAMDVGFAFVWEHLTTTGESSPNPEEALYGVGEAINWVSTSTDPDAVYCVDIVIVYTPSCGDAQTLTFSQFTVEELAHSLRDGTVDCKGKCNSARPN